MYVENIMREDKKREREEREEKEMIRCDERCVRLRRL